MSDSGPGLVSVGYEGRTLEDLLEVLQVAGVEVVADVRLTPISRKAGLSKTKLSTALAAVGVDYVHLRELGNPANNREPFWRGRPAVGVRRFRTLMREPERSASVDKLVKLSQVRRVAVLCFERDHDRCHRQVVTDEVRIRSSRTAVAHV